MIRRAVPLLATLALALVLVACGTSDAPTLETQARSDRGQIGVNVLLDGPLDRTELRALAQHGRILDTLPSIDALTMRADASQLDAIRALDFVVAANPDAERTTGPIETTVADELASGLSTWNLDAVDVTDVGFDNRQVEPSGAGVYVAVIDTGLLKSWPSYFPEERIATEHGRAFGGGGGERGNVSTQPNKWERDVNSHGTHVTSTILGYSLGGTPVNGVAPNATVIPVKALNQNGSGWSSVVAQAITYVADLKAGPLADAPVVINMSLGGPVLDAVEQAAIDYAIEQGVVIVASAGNNGEAGMGYPGAYAPVVSVAASGWIEEWVPQAGAPWWYGNDVPEGLDPTQFYITDFSSRELAGQDLDVAAPGSWVVGPYQLNQGQPSYYFLGGTSMASPHVAGIAALMLETNAGLTQDEVEDLLTSNAVPFAHAGGADECRTVAGPSGVPGEICWGPEASGSGLVDTVATLNAVP